ncbi:MAG: ATP-binding cassette domain-containing protein, partial [Candidatus Thermoplasmatota archaeon]|nr:ATP-binding cassette domain-containing protein [Candidatus Thermoplasmatota archaeon]
MNNEIIRLKGITKQYDAKTTALNNLNLSVIKGSWTSIMGPSGSGKTTLLNILGCLDSPNSGSITINDTEITHLTQ